MEVRKYDLTEFDALWKQYASLTVTNEAYDFFSYIRAESEGMIMLTFPLKVMEEEYRIPHFAVVLLSVEGQVVEDRDVYQQFFMIREFNADEFPDGTPVKELRLVDVPFDFDGKIWLDSVHSYLYSLEQLRRQEEIDAITEDE